jgi:hypothetical protein
VGERHATPTDRSRNIDVDSENGHMSTRYLTLQGSEEHFVISSPWVSLRSPTATKLDPFGIQKVTASVSKRTTNRSEPSLV